MRFIKWLRMTENRFDHWMDRQAFGTQVLIVFWPWILFIGWSPYGT